MSESAPKQFTQEQLDRIAFNKAQALERLKAKRKAAEESTPTENKAPPKKARWIKSFYEYDLSTMVDSKGGFIIDEATSNEKELQEKSKSYVIEPYFRK